MVPRHLYEGSNPISNPNGNAPVGTGPYVFKEWVRGSHVMFERNPNYWDPDLPRIDRMVCKFVPDPGARSVAFENGSGDIGYRTPVALADVARLEKLPHLVFSTDGTSYSYNVQCIQFNLDSEYFKDVRVRRAVAHAIDRSALLKAVAYGYGTVSDVPIAPGLKEFHDPTPSPWKFDLKSAEQLLDEAGLKRGANKVRFKVPMDFNPIGDDGRRTCEFVRAALNRIGIAVEIRAEDISAFAKRIYTDRAFDFTYNGHSNLFDPTVGVQRTTTTRRSTRCSRAPRSRTIRRSGGRCSWISRRSTCRTCPTSASIRRSTSRSRTSACTRIRRPRTASSPTCRAFGWMRSRA
jgi:peptide/nickel transport system substrate-binding protein